MSLQPLLVAGGMATVVLWAALSVHVLAVERRRVGARRVLSAAVSMLQDEQVRGLTLAERTARLQPLVAGASRELIMRAAADRDTPDDAFAAIAGHLAARWGVEGLLQDAAAHHSARDKWRRTAALRIVHRMRHADAIALLARAVDDGDADVANLALSLLGMSADPRAMDILIDALKGRRHPASQVAVHIEQSPQPVADRLMALLDEEDAVVRLWGATLLAKYPGEDIEQRLVPLTADGDPRVRKAAIQTLGTIGDTAAAGCAESLLADPFPYVRAHAARALGDLGRTDSAPDVAALLGDEDWWVRLAARESLEAMGTDVWPVAMRCLDHEDRFVRNGAAEVIQNLGVLDSLIVMEAASDNPADAKIALLGRIAAAGGVRFTDSLVERAGPTLGPRIRHLLAVIGLERVAA